MRLFFRNLMVLALLLGGVAPLVAVDNGTRGSINAKLAKAEGKRGTAGCMIVDLDTGDTIVSHNADTPLTPASNMKLLTTIAALEQLGPDFEFVTRVMSRGSIRNGTLTGDLCIMGGGDPNISGRFHEDDPTALFKQWGAKLKEAGITNVSGDLQYDSTLFGGDAYCEGWPQDDQYIKWYCAEVSALAFNDNCVGIRVLPTKPGQAAKIEVIPPTSYVKIVNETRTAAGRKGAEIGILRPRGTNTITVKGTVYEQATWGYFTDVTVSDPAAFAATVFKETLQSAGVTVQGSVTPITVTNELMKNYTRHIEHRSALLKALPPINTNSQNLHAEMLFRQLGVRYSGKGTFKTGAAAMGAFLKEEGLLSEKTRIADGSGLARGNDVSARLIVKLLQKAAEGEYFDAFKGSLAVGGETGTLEKRLKDKSVRGSVYAKTGYINGVRSLSGYLITDERRIAFSMLMNNCVYTKQMQDEILEVLAKAVK